MSINAVFVFIAGFAGTPGYLSPEVLRKEAYGKPVDIWACGEYTDTHTLIHTLNTHTAFLK